MELLKKGNWFYAVFVVRRHFQVFVRHKDFPGSAVQAANRHKYGGRRSGFRVEPQRCGRFLTGLNGYGLAGHKGEGIGPRRHVGIYLCTGGNGHGLAPGCAQREPQRRHGGGASCQGHTLGSLEPYTVGGGCYAARWDLDVVVFAGAFKAQGRGGKGGGFDLGVFRGSKVDVVAGADPRSRWDRHGAASRGRKREPQSCDSLSCAFAGQAAAQGYVVQVLAIGVFQQVLLPGSVNVLQRLVILVTFGQQYQVDRVGGVQCQRLPCGVLVRPDKIGPEKFLNLFQGQEAR